LREARGDEQRFVAQLAPGESEYGVAPRGEVGIAGAVALERGAAAVGGVAVGLDDHAVLRPEEVDSIWAERLVDPRSRETGVRDEHEHAALELAAGGGRPGG